MATQRQPIDEFISMCRTVGTGRAYRTGIHRFLDYVYHYHTAARRATPEEIAGYEKFAARYLKEKRNVTADIIGYTQDLNHRGVPPKTAHINLCGVRQWLIENDIQFTEKQKVQMRRVSPKGGRRTNIKYADVQTIRDILGQSDPRLKALVLVLASSGMRIGEALNLRWPQVRIPDRTKEADRDKLTELFIEDSKNQTSRRVWITREAEEALLAWKVATPDYLKTVTTKGKNLGLTGRRGLDYVFPYGTTAVYVMWDAACKAAGHYHLDEKTHRNQLNIHRLRGFFKTQTMSVIPAEIAELIMGHSDPYGNAYNGLPDGKLEKEYQKCESALTIAAPYGVAGQMKKQVEETEQLKEEVRELKEIIKGMMIKDGFPETARDGTHVGINDLNGRTIHRIIL